MQQNSTSATLSNISEPEWVIKIGRKSTASIFPIRAEKAPGVWLKRQHLVQELQWAEQPLATPSEGSSTNPAWGVAPRGGDAWKRQVTERGVTTTITGGFQDVTGEGAGKISPRLPVPEKVGPDDLSRPLPTWAALWFYETQSGAQSSFPPPCPFQVFKGNGILLWWESKIKHNLWCCCSVHTVTSTSSSGALSFWKEEWIFKIK